MVTKGFKHPPNSWATKNPFIIVNYNLTIFINTQFPASFLKFIGWRESIWKLVLSTKFNFYINAPEEDEMTLVSTRFFDYDASADLSSQESVFLDEINAQIVQDVTNKLLSNW